MSRSSDASVAAEEPEDGPEEELEEEPSYSTYKLDKYTEDVEDLDRYCVGGYHPINLGDRLNNRYEIIHKLGFGSYAVVWLAHDSVTETNVAIKVLAADDDRSAESKVLAALESSSLGNAAAVSRILDEFIVTGPNGQHQCLVMAAARSSVLDAREWSSRGVFQLSTARAIVAQLVQAVVLIRDSGIVHGDLHPGNVLLQLPPSLEHTPANKLYEKCGEPEFIPVARSDGQALTDEVPSHAVVRADIVARCDDIDLEEAQILLSDFGEAFRPATDPRHELRTPLIFRPPEHIIESATPVSFSADVWTLACTIFVILGQHNLFETFIQTDDEVLTEQLDSFGSMPTELFALWKGRGEYFTEDQKPVNRGRDGPYETFSERVRKSIVEGRRRYEYGQLAEDEVRALEALLRSMLAMKAEERISAREVLESAWMVEWALPDLKRAQELWAAQKRGDRSDSVEAENVTKQQSDANLCDEASADGGISKELRSDNKDDQGAANDSADNVLPDGAVDISQEDLSLLSPDGGNAHEGSPVGGSGEGGLPEHGSGTLQGV